MSTDWLEGPALDILVEFGGLQPGDELKVDGLSSHDIPPGVFHAKVVRVEERSAECTWQGRHRLAVATILVNEMGTFNKHWIICRETIVAWRRRNQ